ncbi:MAG: FlgD immunoglobulin-like domain containing protein [Candidatus Krumholzibacteriia bacterium]
MASISPTGCVGSLLVAVCALVPVAAPATDTLGPSITAEEIDLAQDAFPERGLIDFIDLGNNWCRFDSARDVANDPVRWDPGDSIVVSIVPQRTDAQLTGPNPFNPRATIRFVLPRPTVASVKVLDLRGRCVRTLLDAFACGSGAHEVVWEGDDDEGGHVSSGVYCYEVTAGRDRATGKLALLK